MTKNLTCYGGTLAPPSAQLSLEVVDLGSDYDYFAWVTTPYFNVLQGGTIGDVNAAAADIIWEDPTPLGLTAAAPPLPAIAYGDKLGPDGDWSNLRPMAWHGHARLVCFRLRVWGSALEVAAQGHILYPI